jgi:type IV pilus assembly protein PilQ
LHGDSLVNRNKEGLISIKVKDADVRDLLIALSDFTGKNIVIDPAVKGKITLNLHNVTWQEALDAILYFNDLGFMEIGENGYVGQYAKLVKTVSNLAVSTGNMSEDKESMVTFHIPLSFDFAKILWPSVRNMLSPEGKFLHDMNSNTAIITDHRSTAEDIYAFILIKKEEMSGDSIKK